MKIKSLRPLENGLSEAGAETLWSKIEGFAAYSFNLSHSVEYTVISYLTMWFKVHYPAEFYAATMSVIDDDEKLSGLVLDARKNGIQVLPPDINRSSNRIEISDDTTLYAPFQAIKGISDNVAGYILKARREAERPWVSYEEFEESLKAAGVAGKVNKAHREKLIRVGAFANIQSETKPAMHPDRLKDRIELMPGFTVDAVKADRGINDERLAKLKIMEVIGETRTCEGCSLKGTPHPIPRLGGKPKFMVVFDAPSFQEGKGGKFLLGNNADYLKIALAETSMSFNDGYFTALVKAPKERDAKGLSNEQINGCSKYLAREIDILKPPVILALGSNAVRYFSPGIKGTPAELAGKVIFRPDLDASVIFGINPATIFHNPSNIKLLQDCFAKLAELVS